MITSIIEKINRDISLKKREVEISHVDFQKKLETLKKEISFLKERLSLVEELASRVNQNGEIQLKVEHFTFDWDIDWSDDSDPTPHNIKYGKVEKLYFDIEIASRLLTGNKRALYSYGEGMRYSIA